jgi:hypothetical protein
LRPGGYHGCEQVPEWLRVPESVQVERAEQARLEAQQKADRDRIVAEQAERDERVRAPRELDYAIACEHIDRRLRQQGIELKAPPVQNPSVNELAIVHLPGPPGSP